MTQNTIMDRFERKEQILNIKYAMINLKEALKEFEGCTDREDGRGLEYIEMAIKNVNK